MRFITSARVARSARSARAASFITSLARTFKTKVVVKAVLFEVKSAINQHEGGGVVVTEGMYPMCL